MSMGILARGVQFVTVMCVLDGAHSQPDCMKVSNQFAQQRRLAVILASDDVHASHGDGLHPFRRNVATSNGARTGDFRLMLSQENLPKMVQGRNGSIQPLGFQ